MTCPTEMRLSFYADGELAGDQAAAMARHLAGCGACRELATALDREAEALRRALGAQPQAAVSPVPSAGSPTPAKLIALGLALAALALAGRVWAVSLEAVPGWLNPLALEGSVNLIFGFLIFLARFGGALMTRVDSWSLSMAAVSLVLLSLSSLGRFYGLRPWSRSKTLPLGLLTLVLAVLPQPAAAWDFRSGGNIIIAEGETVDETLVAAGEVIRIDGNVNGDVLAFARQVTINGAVSGSLLTAAQTIDANGEVGGSLAGFGQWVNVGATVSGNLYSFGQNVRLLEGGSVRHDALLVGDLLEANGSFDRDLNASGGKLTVSGRIGRNLSMEGDELELTSSGVVGGSVDARLPADDRLVMAAGSVVEGTTEVTQQTATAKKSRYRDPGFYIWGLIRLAGAFVLGSLLLWLVPGMFGQRFGSAGAGFARAGIGFLVLVATPVALLLTGVTLIGLRLALVGGALFVVGLYLAKIIVADWLGRSVIGSDGSRPGVYLALLVGLAILTVAGALPWIGFWVGLAVLLLGLGMLFGRLLAAVRADRATAG